MYFKSTLIGNLGQDAQVRTTDNGRKAITFSVAVNERWKDGDGILHEKTTWINCTIWRDKDQNTEIAKYLKAGVKVFAEGEISCHAWKDKESNEIRAGLDMRVDYRKNGFLLLSNKPQEEAAAQPQAQTEAPVDDLPF